MIHSNKAILEMVKLKSLEGKSVTLITTKGNITQIIPGSLNRDSNEDYHHYSSLGKIRIHANRIRECIHYQIDGEIYEGKIVLHPIN